MYLILFNESNEGGALDFDGLTGSVVEGNNKMEKIWFSQIARWLFFEIGTTDAQAEMKKEKLSFRIMITGKSVRCAYKT